MSHVPYASAVGSLMYAMVCTRPDIAHAVGVLSRYMSKSGKEHWTAAKRVFRYLRGTTSYGLCYQGRLGLDRVVDIHGFVDADWAGDLDRRRSTSGYVFRPIWRSGSSSKEGSGAGILLISPSEEVITLSYKLEFETTNNIVEYEALVLGLRAAKDMAIDCVAVFGDSELIINQVRNIYQDKQQRLKQYRNEVWDLIDNFFLAFNISFIPREQNQKEDSLALASSTFRPPIGPNIKYQVEIRHRTTIPDNIKHWQVFSDDLELQIFLHTIDEFSNISIDQESQEGEDEELEDQQASPSAEDSGWS
jgi:ribonuclease HI